MGRKLLGGAVLGLALLAPVHASAQAAPEDEVALQRDAYLDRGRVLNSTLVGWSAASIATGGIMWASSDDPFVQSAGIQQVAWGGIDAILAVIGMVVASIQSQKPAPVEDWIGRRETASTIYWVNAGLDVAYIGAGALMLGLGEDDMLRGAGAGVMVQGTFLLGFDIAGGAVMGAEP